MAETTTAPAKATRMILAAFIKARGIREVTTELEPILNMSKADIRKRVHAAVLLGFLDVPGRSEVYQVTPQGKGLLERGIV
jgi:hypothetical protein